VLLANKSSPETRKQAIKASIDDKLRQLAP
jgi:hypothetical protein